MKYAALFVFVAFAFLAQANARSVVSVDRGAIADAMKAKLVAAKEKLNNMLNNASGNLKEKIAEIQKKADELLDQLKEKAQKVADKVYVAADKVIAKVEEFEDKYYAPYFGKETTTVTVDAQPTEPSVESQ